MSADPKDPKDPSAPEVAVVATDEGTEAEASRGPAVVMEPGPGPGSMLVQDPVPDTMFVFPLRSAVPFPNLMMPLLLDSPAGSDPELRPFSLIAATYFDGRSTGTVGIIGPTRMRYSKAISAVDIAAIAVARVLRDVN